MIAITIGFEAMAKNSPAVCLYCGPDAAVAKEIAEAPPGEFARTEVFKNPVRTKRFVGPFLKAEPVVVDAPPPVKDEEDQEGEEGEEEEKKKEEEKEPVALAKEEKPKGLQGLGGTRK